MLAGLKGTIIKYNPLQQPACSLQLARSTVEMSGTKFISPQPATTDKPALAYPAAH